jgi:hypothetical protein
MEEYFMADKYKIIKSEFIDTINGRLYRIIRIKDDVRGGFIASTKNLDQSGNAWVSGKCSGVR